MTALFTLLAIVAVVVVVYSMWLFDCLVKWEYEHHRERWEQDGKPDGFFWRAKECSRWSSDLAKKRVQLSWLFEAPEWIMQRQECRSWLTQMRIIFVVACLAVLIVLVQLAYKNFVR